jgi:PAS domain S-box-containing protein
MSAINSSSLSPDTETSPSSPSRKQVSGKGEMADLIRTHDWASTPLGPIDTWSDALLYSVNLMLSCQFPTVVFWGQEMIQFYNDGYRPLMAEKHPTALGQSARECWKEAWHLIGPQWEAVLANGETTYMKEVLVPVIRNGRLQDIFWTYSYSPIYSSTGTVDGILIVCHDVTDEVFSARRLRESEARATRILESIGDAVIVTDAQSHVIRMNPVAEGLTGWTAANACSRPLTTVFHIVDETTREIIESPAEKVKRLGTPATLDHHTVLIRKDGTETPIDDSVAPIRDREGNITGAVLVFRDIRERRAAERERDAIAKQLQQAFNVTTDGVLSVDRSWQITFANQRAKEILAASGELLDKNFWQTFPGTIYEGSPYVENYNRAMDNKTSGQFEAFYPEPLNAWFTVTVQPSDDGIILFFRDVTQQRREAEALRESEARFNAIYSASHEYIGIITPAGVVLHCNPASLEFANNTQEDVAGMNFWETPWFINTPGAPEMVEQAIGRAATGEFVRLEFTLLRPTGEAVAFDFSLAPVRDADGKVVFLVPEARDITELKRAEAALMQSEKLAAVGRLASSIAHEINNPLESVMNLIYLARRHAIDPDAQMYLDTADQEIRRVSIIANQTLRFHKQPSNPQEISCSDLFATVLSIYEGKLKNAGIVIEKRYRADRPILCFEGDIRQVLNNLVGNAIDAMPAGGRLLVRSRTATEWSTGRRGLALTIADTGVGMNPLVMQKIFDPFFTTKGIAGTGLGLWVSQEIAERHKGTLTVRSSQRQGTCGTVFNLFLPFDATKP